MLSSMKPNPKAVGRSGAATRRAVSADEGPQMPAPPMATTVMAANASGIVVTKPYERIPSASMATAPSRMGRGPKRSTNVPETGEISSARTACHARSAVATLRGMSRTLNR